MDHISQVIFPTAYFPPISYLAKMLQFDSVDIEGFETYPKQTLRNRCKILTSNGLLNLSVPVVKVDGNKTITNNILIFNDDPWQLKHFRALESAYKSSPFFDHYIHHFEKIFHGNFEKLTDLNNEILRLLFNILKIQTKAAFTTTYLKESETLLDFRMTYNKSEIIPDKTYKSYNQVFSDRFDFQPDLSILDLLFNEGPNTMKYLQSNL